VSTPAAPNPDELRATVRAARRALGEDERRSAQAAIVDRLLSLDELRRAVRVGWYLATDGEVDAGGAVDALRARGAQLWLPVVGPERSMRFAPWRHDTAMQPNRYGIDEPVLDDTTAVDADGLDAVVVPCVAVDERGHRVGFGAGYYDRALEGTSAARIGVAFELQVVAQLTPAPWDVPLDVVVTESRSVRPDADDPGRR
jgi:5-formyltetrahydrofolate cyclo-ligase